MALDLARAYQSWSTPPRPLSGTALPHLSPTERRHLAHLDHDPEPAGWTVERCFPVAAGWLVGRRTGRFSVWRLLGPEQLERVHHPAWLWNHSHWLDPTTLSDQGTTPAVLPLRASIKAAGPLGGSRRRCIKALASLVGAMRGRPGPFNLVVPEEQLASASHPARAFVLALLTLLPEGHRLRVSVGEPHPDPRHWDLVVSHQAHEGFTNLYASEPPGEGPDLVAYYIRHRLHANDTETIEGIARSSTNTTWAEVVAHKLLNTPGDLDHASPQTQPERTVRALSAQLRALALVAPDTPLSGYLPLLLETTHFTSDPRPWQALRHHPVKVRLEALQALLSEAEALQPTPSLIQALASNIPKGQPVSGWISALCGWLRAEDSVPAILSALEEALLHWPLEHMDSTRASVWSEVVVALVHIGQDEAAMDALVSPVAHALAKEGAGQALATSWATIPHSFRDPARFQRLIAMLAGGPHSGHSLGQLLLHVRHQPQEVQALLRAWAQRTAPDPHDPLLTLVREDSLVHDVARALIRDQDPGQLASHITPWTLGPNDPLWRACEAALAELHQLSPRERFLALGALGPGLPALEVRARALVADALAHTSFPDKELQDQARQLIELADASPLWPWLVITSAPPLTWDDATTDSAVVEFLQSPPQSPLEQQAAARCAYLLGASTAWATLEHARWIVRVSLAPTDGSVVAAELALALLQGMASRADSGKHVAEIANSLLGLPEEHPALVGFFLFLLPSVWPRGAPNAFRVLLDTRRIPPALKPAVERLIGDPC